MSSVEEQLILNRFKRFVATAKPGRRFVYFTTPPGSGEYANPERTFAYAREQYARGTVALFQRRIEGGIAYEAVACSLPALEFIDNISDRGKSSQPRVGTPTSLRDAWRDGYAQV